MVILTALAILCAPYLLIKLIRDDVTRTPHTDHPHQANAEPIEPAGMTSQDGAAWTALDDRQLTRLLTSSAPRTATE